MNWLCKVYSKYSWCVLQTRYAAAPQKRRSVLGGPTQLAARPVLTRGLHHLLLQHVEGHPHVGQGECASQPHRLIYGGPVRILVQVLTHELIFKKVQWVCVRQLHPLLTHQYLINSLS